MFLGSMHLKKEERLFPLESLTGMAYAAGTLPPPLLHGSLWADRKEGTGLAKRAA